MTIARRLIILLAVPLLILVGLEVFTLFELSRIEARSRFVAESRIEALATLGALTRSFTELRVNARDYLLASNQSQRTEARSAFDEDERDVNSLLQKYADHLISSDQGRRFATEYRDLSREWITVARQAMSLVDAGRTPEAVDLVRALRQLPERQRMAVVLHDYADRPTREVAAALGVSTATVRVHLSHGRRKLRGLLEERHA